MERRDRGGSRRASAGRPAGRRQLGKENPAPRNLSGKRKIYQRHHVSDADGAHRRFERAALGRSAGGMPESEMNRRDFVRTGAMAGAMGVTGEAAGAPPSFTTKIVRLNLQHTWTTTMSSSQYRDTLTAAYTRDGITGHGEGAPIVRYHEDAASAQKACDSVRDLLLKSDPMRFSKIMAEVSGRVKG